jgi:hypothetical protein
MSSAPAGPVIWIMKDTEMKTLTTTTLGLRLAALLGTSAFFAVSPVTVQFDGVSALPQVTLSAALASNSGSGGDDDHSGSGGGDDHSGHGGDDDHDDDNGGDDSGDDSSDDSSDDNSQGGTNGGGSSAGGAGQVTKIETSASGIEVTYADGSREEIENGRYERKNSAGRTVEERTATQADFDRLSALF